MKPNYSEAEKAIRRTWISKMVSWVFSKRGYVLSCEKVAEHAELWEPAFWRIATEQLESVYEAGSAKMATDANQFVLLWEMKVEAQWREREYQKRQREYSQSEKEAETGAASPEFIAEMRARLQADMKAQRASRVH